MTCPIVSIVIIGRNEGQRLIDCLKSIKKNDFTPELLEVIYVDSNSTDNSKEQAKLLGAAVFSVNSAQPTAALARNIGWQNSKAPYVLFLDGDTILDPSFLQKAVKEFSDPKIAVVFGNRREINPKHTIYNRILDLDWIFPTGYTDFCGGDALIRRSVLLEINGYDPKLIAGEEPEMCRRIREKGYLVLHIDHAMTSHNLAMKTSKQYLLRAIRTGYAYAKLSEKFKNTSIPLWKKESENNIIRGVFFISLTLLSIVLTITFQSFFVLISFTGLLIALTVRTAFKFRWKSDDYYTLFLYSFHSHFQQIPILIGQVTYWREHFSGKRRNLIEYK
jgi:glycosyltransferase involved in cell wall biosynthesis